MTEHAIRCDNYGSRSESAVSYWKHAEHGWYIHWPKHDLTGSLSAHKVEEHEDGTISVTPSILTTYTEAGEIKGQVHGYLTRGIWTDC